MLLDVVFYHVIDKKKITVVDGQRLVGLWGFLEGKTTFAWSKYRSIQHDGERNNENAQDINQVSGHPKMIGRAMST